MPAGTSAAAAKIFARWTIVTGPGFIDHEIAAIDILAVERLDGFLSFFLAAHRNKPKTARALGCAVHHEESLGDGSERGEQFFKRSFRRLEGEIAYIEFHDICENELFPGPPPILKSTRHRQLAADLRSHFQKSRFNLRQLVGFCRKVKRSFCGLRRGPPDLLGAFADKKYSEKELTGPTKFIKFKFRTSPDRSDSK